MDRYGKPSIGTLRKHGRRGLWVLCVLSRLIDPAPVAAQTPPPTNSQPQVLVGELSGEFSVNNLGAFNYTVPLAIPPGTAGVEPKLSIAYSSRGGNGLLGLGFSLEGLSTITRAGTSLDQDGFIDGIDFDDNDRFLLDGQRLDIVAIGGTATNDVSLYGDADTEYRTEIDSFSRVIAYGQAGNGPAWFKVWTKSGLIYEYGNTTDSAFMPGTNTTVMSWHVNKVSDTVGNYMEFTYETNSSGSIISQIDYTGNAGASLSTYNSVEFEYEGRPDLSLHYFLGAEMHQTNRLAKIIMKHGSNHVHDYRLSYTNNAAGQSLLASLQQFFDEGTNVDRLPETRFEYSGMSTSATNFNYTWGTSVFHDGSENLFSFIGDHARCFQGDFNGDGLSDIGSLGPDVAYGECRWIGLSDGDGSFTYTKGTNALPSDLYVGVGTLGCLVQTGDFDGDGLTDLIGLGPDLMYGETRWVGLSNGDGTFDFTTGTNALPSGLDVFTDNHGVCKGVLVADFNGDGMTDICSMGPANDERWIGISNGDGTFNFTGRTGTNALPSDLDSYLYPAGSTLLSGDFNGDGRADVCSVGPGESMSHDETRWLGLANTNGTFDFTSGTNMLAEGLISYTFVLEYYEGQISYSSLGCVLNVADFNADGWADIFSLGYYDRDETCWVALSNGDGSFDCTSYTNFLPSDLEAFTMPTDEGSMVLTGDFNNDGLADIYAVGPDESQRWLGLSRGDGTFDFTEGYDLLPDDYGATPASWYPTEQKTGDFNADGRIDVCCMGFDGGAQYAEGRWLGLGGGDGTFEYASGDAFREGRTSYHYYSTADFDGDGLPDIFGALNSDSQNNTNYTWVGMNGNEASRLVKVVQGYRSETEHGVVTEIEYSPLTDTNIYVKGSGAEWPVRDGVPAMHVVSTLTKDNGQGGTYATDYTYRSARRHYHGRGFLGFQQFESYDRQTRISTVETLAHDFPFTGRVLQTETFHIPDPGGDPSSPGYAQLLRLVENDWHFDLVSGGTLFAFSPKSVETTWELGNTNDVVAQTTTYNWYDNQSTNSLPPTSQPTNLYAQISYGNLVQSKVDYNAGGLKRTTWNSYDDLVTSTKWLLGRLDESVVTHEASGQSNVVRSSSFDYDSTTGLLSQETIEPGDDDFELITDYYYDSFGNITNKTLTPAGLPSRTVLSVEYDDEGRFVEKSWNALGHETEITNDEETGKPLSSTDPNDLTTSWAYDSTGRIIHEQRPDGTATTIGYSWDYDTEVSIPTSPGSSSNIVQVSVYRKNIKTSGTPEVLTWFDRNGREIRTQTESADGSLVNKNTGYNAIAQAYAVSEPYFASGGTAVYTFTGYDALSRPVLLTAPDSTKTGFGYFGLTTTTTNNYGATDGPTASRNQVTTTTKNAKGEVVSVKDSNSKTVTYLNDPVGNLIKTTDPDSNIIEMEYDIRGNKTSQDDPDMGEWSYTYNALDQLTSQTNANSKVTAFEYDLLGRMTERVSPDGTAEWYFDNTDEGGKLGALWREELSDGTNLVQRKTYAYDALKRPMLELMNHDGKWFYTTFRYDSYSRLEHTDWFWRPQSVIDSGDNLSPDWNTFSMEYVYDDDSGYLTAVKDGTGHEWWSCSLSDYDEQGRVTGFQQGNDVATVVDFDPLTGLVEGVELSNIGAGSYEYGFGYDRLGNLTQRTLSRTSQSSLSETCEYDALNRLTSTAIGATTISSTYNDIGNITGKGGVTDYAYAQNGAGPHAVTTADGVAYSYDDCGNMVSRIEGTNTSSITWTSFNKPLEIERGDNSSEFTYDANHRRVTQLIDSAGTLKKKIYIGNRMEQEENPDGQGGWTNTLTRIFVSTPTGVIGIEERTPSTTTRKYLHRDHLGSVVAVSGEAQSGNAPVLAEYSFDAWGRLRDPSDWSATTNSLSTAVSGDRGFTGHEMLDGISLVHMNGRIYSQELGRFLSPDPLIQAPENLQSFNRYSYVMNRPLTLTDPSGFEAKKKAASSEAATASTKLDTPIESNELSSKDNIGGSESESSTQVDDYYTDGSGNTQVDQTTQSQTTDTPGTTDDVKGEADKKTQFEQTSEGTKTKEHTDGKQATKKPAKMKDLVVNKVYEISPLKKWSPLKGYKYSKRELKSGDTVSNGNSISACSEFVHTEEGAKAAQESSEKSGNGYLVRAQYETKEGPQSVSRIVLIGGYEVSNVGTSTATKGLPSFVNLIDGSRENLLPGSEINISFDHYSEGTLTEMVLYVGD